MAYRMRAAIVSAVRTWANRLMFRPGRTRSAASIVPLAARTPALVESLRRS